MPHRSYRVLLWSLALVGLAADQATKYGVFAWLAGVESHTFALFQTEPQARALAAVPADPLERGRQRGFFLEVAFEARPDAAGRPVPQVNHGALFGFLRNYETAANGGFAVISLLAAAAIVLWSRQRSAGGDRWLCMALGLILGGTLGNLYDRLLFNGVRDFLHWNYLFDWPVFNVADCCLVVGAGLLLVQAFFAPHQAGEPHKGEARKDAVPASPAGGAVAGMVCGAGSSPQL